ncbi:uncharacterized protein K02A2.6-like [Octopus sinensis]|uniref:Uncharacterized protein K02A2.6-like n=1 Tax=Octopus sinensis TaxID=2607531 RepID=A0A6P7TW56_9MOLL|nr:uncharacterized protein K02A2.6-like [Octopus sinensis]
MRWCHNVYVNCSSTKCITKTSIATIPLWAPRNVQNESFSEELRILANLYRDMKKLVKACRGCMLATKVPPVKYQPWPDTESPWSRIPINYAGPLNGAYYMIIVDNCTKWPKVCRCNKPTAKTTIKFLFKLFARYGIPDTLVSDSGTQFTGYKLRNF